MTALVFFPDLMRSMHGHHWQDSDQIITTMLQATT